MRLVWICESESDQLCLYEHSYKFVTSYARRHKDSSFGLLHRVVMVSYHKTTQRHDPEDHNLNLYRSENPSSPTKTVVLRRYLNWWGYVTLNVTSQDISIFKGILFFKGTENHKETKSWFSLIWNRMGLSCCRMRRFSSIHITTVNTYVGCGRNDLSVLSSTSVVFAPVLCHGNCSRIGAWIRHTVIVDLLMVNLELSQLSFSYSKPQNSETELRFLSGRFSHRAVSTFTCMPI